MRRFHKKTASARGAFDLMHGAAASEGGDPKSDGGPARTRTVSTSPTSDAWKNQCNAAQLKTRHPLRRSIISAVAVGALALTAAACGGDDEPETLPTPTTSTSSTPEQSPTPTTPTWESEFTEEQLAEYNEALKRWDTYEQRSEPIWAAGKATPAAQALFNEFFLNPDAQFQTLQTYESVEVTTEGIPKVYWSKALKISDPKTAGTKGMATTIQQCVDYREVKGTQRGEPTKQAKKFQRPVLRQISMTRLGTTWLIANIDDRKGKPCDPDTE
jgi:hypothetical protein